MKFESIELKNFRQYRDVSISFDDHINIIEAGNGVGKSTLMAALIFAMFGYNQAKESGFIEVTKNTPLLNLAALNDEEEIEKEVKVSLSIRTDDQERYEITRVYKHDEERKEILEVQKVSVENAYFARDVGFEEIASIIPEEFIPLLFFDGERIKKIEDSITNKSKGFQEEVEKILKNRELNEAKNLIKRSRDKLIRDTKFNNPKIQELQLDIQETEQIRDKKNEEIERLKDELDNAEAEKEKINNQLRDCEKMRRISKEIQEIESNIEDLDGKRTDSLMKARGQVFDNFPDLIRLNLNEKILEGIGGRVTNYKITGIEQNAIDMIIENGRCICSTQLNDELIYKLKEIRKVLPPESFRTMLSSKLDNKEEDKNKLRSHVKKYTDDFLRDDEKLAESQNKLQVLKASRRFQVDDEDIKRWVNELETVESYIEEKTSELIISKDRVDIFERKIKEKKDKYDRELKTEKDNKMEKEAINLMEKAENEIKEYIKERKESLKEIMEKKVNEYANDLLSEEVEIELDSWLRPKKIKLGNKSEVLSTGQNVIVSLAYLFALMKASKEEVKFGHHVLTEDYPLVFDGVTATLDEYHTRKVINYVEEIENQFIIFANTKEVKLFENKIEGKFKKICLHKDTNSSELKVGD